MSDREERFEAMLRGSQEEHRSTLSQLEQLKSQGKQKTATYKQLLGNKLTLQNILDIYRTYGLVD